MLSGTERSRAARYRVGVEPDPEATDSTTSWAGRSARRGTDLSFRSEQIRNIE
jgi:hypothetical protein